MSVVVSIGGTPLATTRIRLRGGGNVGISGLSSGANGEMEQGAITVEDITYDFDGRGWQTVAVDETDTTTAPRLFSGFIADQTYSRGEHYRVADDRQIDLTINDTNVLLSNDLLLAADSPDRPAEDDAARIAWLLGTVPMSGRIFDLGLIDTIGEQYDATSFLHQSPADVLNDLCSARGNIFFTYWDQDAEQIGLFYDRPIDTTFTCTLTFSNDLDDLTIDGNGVVTGTCFPPYEGSAMLSDPSEIYCRVIYVYKGGAIAVHDSTTHTNFLSSSGDGIPDAGHRTILVENDKVGRVTTATSFANRLLEHYSVERRTVTFTTRLPSTKVGLVQAGMRVGLKFTHLPELSSQQYFRIETLTLAPTEDEPDRAYWDAEITASVHGLGFAPGTGGGSTTTFPPTQTQNPSVAQYVNSVDVPNCIPANDWGIGSIQWGFIGRRGGGSAFRGSGWTMEYSATGDGVNTNPCELWRRTVVTGDTKNGPASLGSAGGWYAAIGGDKAWIAEVDVDGATTFTKIDTSTGTSAFSGGTISNPTGALLLCGGGLAFVDFDELKMLSVGAGVFEFADPNQGNTSDRPWIWGGWLADTPAGSHTVTGTMSDWLGIGPTAMGYSSITVCVAPIAGVGSPPATGQPVGPETVTMSGPNGTTAFPFADGTLKVFVDNTDQTGAITASDGAAGTFTLGFTPFVGEVVTVYYKGI